jgi:hypothetical protein
MKTWTITGYRTKNGEREDVIRYLVDNDETYAREMMGELKGFTPETRRDFYRRFFRTEDIFDGTESWELSVEAW